MPQALEHLVQVGQVSQLQIAEVLADEFNMDLVDLDEVRVSSDALNVVSYALASRYKVFVQGSKVNGFCDFHMEYKTFGPGGRLVYPRRYGRALETVLS